MFSIYLATPVRPVEKANPCYPSPCGSNAHCRVVKSYALCECLPEYRGNPYESCRPECLVNSDCPMNKACIRNKCQDPCPGTCGLGAICSVSNHIPICSCPAGYSGDAFRQCSIIPVQGKFFFAYFQIISRTINKHLCIPLQNQPL